MHGSSKSERLTGNPRFGSSVDIRNKEQPHDNDGPQTETKTLEDPSSSPRQRSRLGSSTSSPRVQDSPDLVSDVASSSHSPTPDMDVSDAHRRRRALLAEQDNHSPDRRSQTKHSRHSRRPGEADRAQDDESKYEIYSSDESGGSDLSSPSMGDDISLHTLMPDTRLSNDEEAGLTKKDRRHRKRKRRKNTQLDRRVMGNISAAKQEEKKADQNVLKAVGINALLIAVWYMFSLSISIYNKWMFSPDHLDFHFPLFTTSLHMLVQFSLASIVLYFIPRFRPRPDSISNPLGHGIGRRDSSQKEKPLMAPMFYLTRIGPCGAATGLDIGLGNTSLKFITLTFFTMCKSSALAFVLLFAFLFHLETPSIKLILIIATMTIGVIMMVAGETSFNTLGFILIISSAFFSGFRWALTQILLLRNPTTSNPFSSIFFLAPVMFLSLAILAIPIEGFSALWKGVGDLVAQKGITKGIGILLFPGALAFLMTSSEFALLKRTSVVTLSICGIFKEVVTISAAGIVFHDPLTPINISGLLVTIASIAAYNYIKVVKMRKEARAQVAQVPNEEEFALPMLPASYRHNEKESRENEALA